MHNRGSHAKDAAWAQAAGMSLYEVQKLNGHCPFVMKAEQIACDDGWLFIVFEQMEMTLT